MVPRVADMEIRWFWMEVPSSSFPIAQKLPMKKMKTHDAKNKIFKPQGGIKYLFLPKHQTTIFTALPPSVRESR
jgi:hypothetical protein